jgi:endonuclease YncB( thermonuclease family)
MALRTFLASIAAMALLACAPAAAEPPFFGVGKAKDGDSLIVGPREVRLFGIDAPEWDQTCTRDGKPWSCGEAAADQLSRLVTGKEVRCQPVTIDEHQRAVARCTVGSVDVNRQMVATGYATAYRHYSMDYVSAEESAKASNRGLWAGTFQRPSDYRHAGEAQTERPARRSRRSIATPVAAPSGCTIKGNQGSNGWIYHVPGMPSYERTKAEQMFCSEAEARAAGYRRAKVR